MLIEYRPDFGIFVVFCIVEASYLQFHPINGEANLKIQIIKKANPIADKANRMNAIHIISSWKV